MPHAVFWSIGPEFDFDTAPNYGQVVNFGVLTFEMPSRNSEEGFFYESAFFS
jgi:hypothetical protein